MVEARKKHLVLILAREFASNLATPTLIADDQGRLVFYNEAAEGVLGRTFAETGEMSLEDWAEQFEPRTEKSEALPLERRPTGIALYQRRDTHRTVVPGAASAAHDRPDPRLQGGDRGCDGAGGGPAGGDRSRS